MAPKLPPPANTKAVLAGPAWLGRDKVSFAPGTGVGRRPRGVRRGYSRRKPGCAINIGCGMPSFRGARERSPRNLLIVVPAKAGTHQHRCLLIHRAVTTALANMPSGGYGSRLK